MMALHSGHLVTTSELPAGNGRTGAPVKAFSTSGGLVRNQGGTVEY